MYLCWHSEAKVLLWCDFNLPPKKPMVTETFVTTKTQAYICYRCDNDNYYCKLLLCT